LQTLAYRPSVMSVCCSTRVWPAEGSLQVADFCAQSPRRDLTYPSENTLDPAQCTTQKDLDIALGPRICFTDPAAQRILPQLTRTPSRGTLLSSFNLAITGELSDDYPCPGVTSTARRAAPRPRHRSLVPSVRRIHHFASLPSWALIQKSFRPYSSRAAQSRLEDNIQHNQADKRKQMKKSETE